MQRDNFNSRYAVWRGHSSHLGQVPAGNRVGQTCREQIPDAHLMKHQKLYGSWGRGVPRCDCEQAAQHLIQQQDLRQSLSLHQRRCVCAALSSYCAVLQSCYRETSNRNWVATPNGRLQASVPAHCILIAAQTQAT